MRRNGLPLRTVSSRVSSGVLRSSASVRPALADSQPARGCPRSHPKHLRSSRVCSYPSSQQLPKSSFRDLKILPWRRLYFLVEGVQDVGSLRAPGQVNHAVSAARVRNANLLDTRADGGHRLEVVGLGAARHLVAVIT